MPELRLNQTYESIEGTVNDGQSDEQVTFTKLKNIYVCRIKNDDTAADFSVRFNNENTNALITIKAGESQVFDLFRIHDIKLTNSSGSNIAYRILAIGDIR